MLTVNMAGGRSGRLPLGNYLYLTERPWSSLKTPNVWWSWRHRVTLIDLWLSSRRCQPTVAEQISF